MDDQKGQSLKARLGVEGLDDIVFGGLHRDRLFIVEGVRARKNDFSSSIPDKKGSVSERKVIHCLIGN